MASNSRFSSEDQFMCSICLEVFTDPVSIPCGHNFCKGCIRMHWEGKELCKCPLCNEKFSKGLKLCVNTAFRDVVENFKKQQTATSNNETPVKPGQVACDCCLDKKRKASKTCLVCLTSFCETHLEPHRKVPALKRHKLTDPVHKLEDKLCKKHNRLLELFCRDDLTRICVQCTEHSAHDTVLLEQAHVINRAQVVIQKMEMQRSKKQRGRKGQKNQKKDKVPTDPCGSFCPCGKSNQCCIYQCVPIFMGFSGGRFCYEVHLLEGITCFVGVIRQSLLGKRQLSPNPKTGSWVIQFGGKDVCTALQEKPVSFILKRPKRVMVCVDYENGTVDFVNLDTGTPFYLFTGCKFNESIFLFRGREDHGRVEKLPMKIRTMEPHEIVLCFLMVTVFLSSILPN